MESWADRREKQARNKSAVDNRKNPIAVVRARGQELRRTDAANNRFAANNLTAGQRAENLSYRERTAAGRRTGVTPPKGMSTKDQLAIKKYNDDLVYQKDMDGNKVMHPGMAVLNRINKSKDRGKAINDLSPEDRVLFDQGKEIVGNMMSLDSPVQNAGDRGAMGRIGGAGAYGAQRPGSTRSADYGRMGRLSDRGSNLANFSNRMDGEMRDGSYSSNRARRLAGERRSGYLQSMQSQRDTYANRNVEYDKTNPEYAGMPSSMMEPGWSPGSRFHQAGNMAGEGIGGSGITLGRGGTYRDAGTSATYREKNPVTPGRVPLGEQVRTKRNKINKVNETPVVVNPSNMQESFLPTKLRNAPSTTSEDLQKRFGGRPQRFGGYFTP